MTDQPLRLGRRTLMISGAAAAASVLARSTAGPLAGPMPGREIAAAPLPRPDTQTIRDAALDPQLLRKALAALDRHAKSIRHRDRIAIVDFSAPSSEPRLHFLDVESGRASRLLVAHGSGSDPHHTGYAERFSNASGSNASSEGAFVTGDYYVGKHGRSQRLAGLDPTNDHAMERAIVLHGRLVCERRHDRGAWQIGPQPGLLRGRRDLSEDDVRSSRHGPPAIRGTRVGHAQKK